MRRLAAALLLTLAAAGGADACRPRSDDVRPSALARYDDAWRAWVVALGDRLRRDPDPDIAYAGWLFGRRFASDGPAPAGAAPIAMPAPTTGLSRLLRFAYCDRPQRCDDDLAAWLAAEPDNAFVIERALLRERRDAVGDADARFRLATRYDDYGVALRALPAKIAARHDVTAPAPPPGYTGPPCDDVIGVDFASAFRYRVSPYWHPPGWSLERDDTIAAATKLHVANRMFAATGTPEAAERAIGIGVGAAVAPADRARWCREKARADALAITLGRRLVVGDAASDERRRVFFAALEGRNAIDAAEVVARDEGETPRAIDEQAIAACVATANGESP